MLRAANFFAVFVGIETPDPDTLVATSKKQNTRRDLVASINKIYGAGMFVTAGFIVGFDGEKDGAGRAITDVHRGRRHSGLHGRPALRACRIRS